MIIREIIHDLLHHTLDEVREKKNMKRLQTDLIDQLYITHSPIYTPISL